MGLFKKEENKFPFKFKRKKNTLTATEMSIIAVAIGGVIAVINFMFFIGSPQLFGLLNLVAVLIALALPIYRKFTEYATIKKIEAIFPQFLRDVTDNINAGMTLPQAIKTASENDYDVMSDYIKELSAKIGWGIAFDKAFLNFADATKSKVIKRTVKGIIEVHKHGGAINVVLRAISESVLELERIKKERETSVYGPMVTGYFIFFLFLGIMITMAKVLIPAFITQGQGEVESVRTFFTDMFRNMVVIQGVFAGIGIGKMAEGTVSAGIKHAFVLAIIGYTVFIVL
ncbi:MAG: type II secretion system F family protein [Candidatus Aenigmarchaeota archaeon]|nr:type II secretion system F family protein [Candidatus Aenigmarchaeota archaeon]